MRSALLVALWMLAAGAWAQGPTIWAVSPAAMADDAPIPDDVRADCRLPEKLGQNFSSYLRALARKRKMPASVVPARDLKDVGQDRAVTLTILAVYGHGATSWSGTKSITARVDLYQDGKLVDSRLVRGSTKRGGMGGTLSSACSIFNRTSVILAKQAAVWIVLGQAFERAGSSAQRHLAIEAPARLESDVPLPEAVLKQCGVQTMLTTHLFDRVSQGYAGTLTVKPGEAPDGLLLRVSILELEGRRAGGVTGSKTVSARAELFDGMSLMASQEFGSGSGTSNFTNTCELFENAVIDVAQQIARWLPSFAGAGARDGPVADAPAEGDEPEEK
jgi:hypothetical protein